jgi:hypothetical protein
MGMKKPPIMVSEMNKAFRKSIMLKVMISVYKGIVKNGCPRIEIIRAIFLVILVKYFRGN